MTQHPYAIGANAAAEATHNGTLNALVDTLLSAKKSGQEALYSGGRYAMLVTLEALRKSGADFGAVCDAQAADFLRKGSATIEAEVMTATGAELEWRMKAIAGGIMAYRTWVKKTEVIETPPKAQPAAMPVQVVSMPDRVSVQSVERDGDGEITSTTTVQKDFA